MTFQAKQRNGIDRFDVPTQTPGGLQGDKRAESLMRKVEARTDALASAKVEHHVREARSYVRNWTPNSVSAETGAQYARTVEHMRTTASKPEDAHCKATFESSRSALIHVTRTELKQALSELDRSRRKGNMDAADMAYQRVQQGLDVLRQYPPGTGNRQLDLQRHSSYRGPNRPARSNGKRPSIDGLPDDWMDKVQAEVRAQDKPAVAAMAITGCRPAECDGIKVRQRTEVITFSVRGAKLDEDRGIAVRQISVSRDELQKTQAGRDIADWLGNRPVRTITVRSSTEAFCERVSRAADRAEISQVSAYTYRHHEARTLKQSGMDRSEIATRLGHRSDRSQSAYG